MTFKSDLKKATLTEHATAELIDFNYDAIQEVWVRAGKDSRYDVKAVIYYEVKHDLKHIDTQNIAIEFECNGKPSGISVTEAYYWVQVLPKKNGKTLYFIIPVHKLRQLIEEGKYFDTKYSAGDDNASLYLFKKADFIPHCQILKQPKEKPDL